MPLPYVRCQELVRAVARRTSEIVDALADLDEPTLRHPSLLPEWSRLTIACHLRYGAEALTRMTAAVQSGGTASYYPNARDVQRPQTLVPRSDEAGGDVVGSLAVLSGRLDREWSRLESDAWALDVVEPVDNPDLGTVAMGMLPLLRLTEVEVHGTDLGIGLDDWSDLFVHTALPLRLSWLSRRRANHRAYDSGIEGSWLLVATDGPATLVTVNGGTVESVSCSPTSPARAVVEGTSRDLLSLLLDRDPRSPLRVSGDHVFASSFRDAFPGP